MPGGIVIYREQWLQRFQCECWDRRDDSERCHRFTNSENRLELQRSASWRPTGCSGDLFGSQEHIIRHVDELHVDD
jgi:hypothetical protein